MTYPTATHITEHFTWCEYKMDPRKATAEQKARAYRHCRFVLEPIRAHFGKSVHITEEGGFREPAVQKAIWANDLRKNGGKPSGLAARPGSSRHEYGDASDIWIAGVTPSAIVAYAITIAEVGGVHAYGKFAHIDSRLRYRNAIARW